MNPIPLVDLAAQHESVGAEIEAELTRLMRSSSFILGETVETFERAFADYESVTHCVGVANGTDAIELAVRALGLGPGDEVLIPANTFAATALATARAGATPVFVDCNDDYQLIDLEAASARVGERTKAIIPVHLFGQMAPMAAVSRFATAHGLSVIEDAAQAHGATQEGSAPSARSSAATFSFYPSKNLGAYGDAGAVVTNDDAIAARVKALRNYGSDVKYEHPVAGFNSRLDTLQAAVLSIKLRHLEAWNDKRRAAARLYDELLEDLDVARPETMPGNVHVWHLYVVRVDGRDAILRSLHDQGIGAGIHYPKPLHLQGAFASLGYRRGEFPVAERLAHEILSLPLYPEITPDRQERVVDALRKAMS